MLVFILTKHSKLNLTFPLPGPFFPVRYKKSTVSVRIWLFIAVILNSSDQLSVNQGSAAFSSSSHNISSQDSAYTATSLELVVGTFFYRESCSFFLTPYLLEKFWDLSLKYHFYEKYIYIHAYNTYKHIIPKRKQISYNKTQKNKSCDSQARNFHKLQLHSSLHFLFNLFHSHVVSTHNLIFVFVLSWATLPWK